jgi:hypothetical protein
MSKFALASAIAGSWLMTQGAMAAGGDFKLDFTAAAPTSYNHLTGGGAYNDRTIGKDVVESLEGSDFACGDTVTFLTRIAVDDGAVGAQSLALGFEFTAHSTGRQGVAFVDNIDGESAAINGSDVDSGTVDDGGSMATLGPPPPGEILNGAVFVKPTQFFRTVTVDDLEAGETVVLRTDVRIVCNGQKATGNLLARLFTAGSGEQTIPLRNVGAIQPPPLK